MTEWAGRQEFVYSTRRRYKRYVEIDEVIDEKDDRIDAYLVGASRYIDMFCGSVTNPRRFFPYLATLVYDYQAPRILHLFHDLLEITSFTDGSGAVTSDRYNLYPLNAPAFNAPYREIRMISPYYLSYLTTRDAAISITGKWGFCENAHSFGTVLASDINSTVTTIAVTTGIFGEGETLLIDSEQMLVLEYQTSSNIIVARGMNGTTAASHTSASSTVSTLHPPFPIEQATSIVAARALARGDTGFSDRSGNPTEGFTYYKELPLDVQAALKRHQDRGWARLFYGYPRQVSYE